MTRSRRAELNHWNDADDLIRSLGKIDEEPNGDLVDEVFGLLGHPDPDVREEALRLLLVRWKLVGLRHHALELLSAGETGELRALAAYGIAATSENESRSRDTAVLKKTLQNDREGNGVRRAAYDALLIMFRKYAFPSVRTTFKPERDVDWEWIETLPID